jgi:D-sedoheptulose 7-phosphate isomerase
MATTRAAIGIEAPAHPPVPPTAPEPSPVDSAVRSITETYLRDFRRILDQIDTADLCAVVKAIRVARDTGGTIFIAGNGGSAATATHWVNDLGKATKVSGRPALRVVSLSDNVSWLTALANDEGYDRVFAGQLENFGSPGDLLIVISASGNSPNLLRAVDTAEACGMGTIGLLGFDGGRLRRRLDHVLWVRTPVGAYGLVETAHTLLADVVTACLVHDREDGR